MIRFGFFFTKFKKPKERPKTIKLGKVINIGKSLGDTTAWSTPPGTPPSLPDATEGLGTFLTCSWTGFVRTGSSIFVIGAGSGSSPVWPSPTLLPPSSLLPSSSSSSMFPSDSVVLISADDDSESSSTWSLEDRRGGNSGIGMPTKRIRFRITRERGRCGLADALLKHDNNLLMHQAWVPVVFPELVLNNPQKKE